MLSMEETTVANSMVHLYENLEFHRFGNALTCNSGQTTHQVECDQDMDG